MMEDHGKTMDATDPKQDDRNTPQNTVLKEMPRSHGAILQSIQDVLFSLDRDWRFTYVNWRAETNADLPPEQILGRNIWERYPELRGTAIEEAYHRVMRERLPFYFEHIGIGSAIWFEIRVYPLDDGGISVCWMDRTERKRAEEALVKARDDLERQVRERTAELQRSNDKLRREIEEHRRVGAALQKSREDYKYIIQYAPSAIYEIDFGNLRFRRVNEVMCAVSGYSEAELLAMNPFSMLDEESRRKFQTRIDKMLAGQKVDDSVEYKVIAKDGREIWVVLNIKIIARDEKTVRALVVGHDITERKRAEEEALASERELLRVTLDSLGEGVVAVDRELRIIFCNETAMRLIGCNRDEAIGQSFAKAFWICDAKTGAPIDVRIPQQHEVNPLMLAKDWGEVPIALNCAPIKAASGQVIGTVAVFQDISEKLKTQQELSKADKLESLGILAGGIAHDFNNILGAILSNVQLAMMKLERNQDIRKYLESTVETTRKASELTKQLLIFSKGGAPVRKDASLVDLIKDTAEFVLRGTNTKAEFAIADPLWLANIDAGQISQMINNLVMNAKQAMPQGGMIRIRADNLTQESGAHLKPGNYVRIAVQDQGIGIPKENLGKIFDPFFTTKKDGNGLGLATSYSIIRHHEGYLEVESREGVGTTFYVYLPAANGMRAPRESRKEAAAAGAGFKILLMDDETNILDAVGEMLMDYGYRVVLARDGDAAIESYRAADNAGEPFDAVIMDLTVPGGKGGQEVCASLRDFDPKIKAIISSGYANDPIMADYQRYGFMGVVSKPYKIDELHEVLRQVLKPGQLPLELGYEWES